MSTALTPDIRLRPCGHTLPALYLYGSEDGFRTAIDWYRCQCGDVFGVVQTEEAV